MNVSLIIASRGRPKSLGLLLSALRFQRDIAFEVIVVTDLERPQVHALTPQGREIRYVHCGAANLAKARNLGIRAAGGDIIAFCDDDAIPEPNWLARLTAPFCQAHINASTGFVRGRNGVSWQWRATAVDAYGNDLPLDITTATQVSSDVHVVKTVGTNCAFRASALAQIGGFDEAYRFFLEDTDLAWRLGKLGGKTAIVPRAEVHHAYAASATRTKRRVPKSLFEIGASKAHFCTEHGEPSRIKEELDGFRGAQLKRLIGSFNLGLLTGAAVKTLMQSLEDGFAEGSNRHVKCALERGQASFTPYQAPRTSNEVKTLSCGLFDARRAHAEAADLAAQDIETTLVQFFYSPRRLWTQFTPQGYWLHRGGVFGKAMRSEPMWQWSTRHRRISKELARITEIRG